MPNEPSFPSDLLSMVAGLGRKAVDWLPEEPKVTPPLTFLEPFYGAGKAPQLSLRDIGSFLIPQTALDVGLTMVPGGRPGKRVKTLFEKLVAKEAAPKSQLVPAIKRIDTGEVLPGKLGQDIWHQQVMKRYGFPENPAIQRNKIVEGFVDSETGEWLDLEQGAKAVGEWAERAAKSRGVQGMPSQATRAKIGEPVPAGSVKRTPQQVNPRVVPFEEAVVGPSNRFVPIVKDPNTGKVYRGVVEDSSHMDVMKRYGIDKYQSPSGPERFERGFVDIVTGEEKFMGTFTKSVAKPAPKPRQRVVPAVKDSSGKVFAATPGKQRTHMQVVGHNKPKMTGDPSYYEYGFKNLDTGEWVGEFQFQENMTRYERIGDMTPGEELKAMDDLVTKLVKPAPKPKVLPPKDKYVMLSSPEGWTIGRSAGKATPVTAAIKDINTGKIIPGDFTKEPYHSTIIKNYSYRHPNEARGAAWDQGYMNMETGEWLSWSDITSPGANYYRATDIPIRDIPLSGVKFQSPPK